jgi:putative transposase
MGRALRIIDNDAIYHAGSRGSNRGPIAWDEQDFQSLLGEIGRVSVRHKWSVLAWCLIPHHYHLVLRTPKGGFSAGFKQINGNHSRRTNRRRGRDAHLFKNRPWAVELTTPAHLVGALAYVFRNPVEAGLCSRPEEWPWSSYRATLAIEPSPIWLAPDEVRPLFGVTLPEVRRNLEGLVLRGQLPVSDTIRSG